MHVAKLRIINLLTKYYYQSGIARESIGLGYYSLASSITSPAPSSKPTDVVSPGNLRYHTFVGRVLYWKDLSSSSLKQINK